VSVEDETAATTLVAKEPIAMTVEAKEPIAMTVEATIADWATIAVVEARIAG